jgi:hypothetical protein
MVEGCVEMTGGRDFATLNQKINDGLVKIAKIKRKFESR